MKEFGLDDVGNTLVLTVKENKVAKDLSATTRREFLIRKPSLATIVVTASFVTDGTDGKLVYTFITSNLDVEGVYEVQAQLEAGGWIGTSSSFKFKVRDTIIAP